MVHQAIALISDLFFASKLEATARAANVPVRIVSSPEAFAVEMQNEPPTLAIIDLNFDATRSVETIAAMKRNPEAQATRIVAFLSHVQVELAESARAAGADVVMPRSVFASHLAEILKGTFEIQ